MPLAKERPLSTALTISSGNTVGERFIDPTNGDVYIFLPGVTSNAVGAWVTFDPGNSYTTALLTKTNADKLLPMAVSMSTATGSQYGWFKIVGRVSVQALASGTANSALYTSGTAGYSDVVATSQTKINRAFYDTARGGTNGLTTAYIQYPSAA